MAAAAAAAARGAAAGPAAWDQVWQQQQLQQQRPVSGWADDFAVQQHQQQAAWVEEFGKAEAAAGPQGWATEFSEAQEAAAVASTPEAAAAAAADARATSARLVDALAADGDPKMRNSKFLQFLSKMSKGELEFEDNKVGTFDVATRIGAFVTCVAVVAYLRWALAIASAIKLALSVVACGACDGFPVGAARTLCWHDHA
jgi:hypothetical protein